ncbi:MAG: hypothetical protein ABSF77_11375 [Spirochaetia bacterium]|jgi:hypothetical protein
MELNEQGVRRSAVALGEASQGTALTRILALKASPGWMVEENAVREWRFEGVKEQNGTLYLYGPYTPGTTLEAALAMPLDKALPLIARLARALSRLSASRIKWFPLQADAVLFTENGGVLFLPPDVHREIRDLRTFAVNRDTFESLNHPDLKGENLASFTLASVLYRIITGRFAFNGADAEEIHEQARKLEIMPPARIVPELSPEVSDLIMAGLGRARTGPVALDEWVKSLTAWQTQDLFRILTAEEREKTLRDAESSREASAKSFRRRMFWEKNWKIAAIIAVVVIVVGAILGSILKNALAPRVTHGYSPQMVVNTFYTSMNTLDHMTMQACVIGKAGQGEINETMTLFVTSRVTQGYEGKSNVLSAADWDKAGRPTLFSPATLYGVTGLSLTQEQGEPTPVFMVEYDKWNPATPADTGKTPSMDQVPQSEGHRIADRVRLRKDKGDWVIYQIDRVHATPLPAPKSEAAPPSANSSGNPLPGASP